MNSILRPRVFQEVSSCTSFGQLMEEQSTINFNKRERFLVGKTKENYLDMFFILVYSPEIQSWKSTKMSRK